MAVGVEVFTSKRPKALTKKGEASVWKPPQPEGCRSRANDKREISKSLADNDFGARQN